MDGKKRLYSIIVVTYNNADGLLRTLKSIRLLDYVQKEIVVIDGGSKDETLNIIADNQDIITTSVSEKDSGIYNAMNKGVKLVSGDYVVFMNAGDEFANKDVLSLVNGYDGDIIMGGYIYGGKFTPEEDELMRRQYSLLQGEDRQIMIVFSLLC